MIKKFFDNYFCSIVIKKSLGVVDSYFRDLTSHFCLYGRVRLFVHACYLAKIWLSEIESCGQKIMEISWGYVRYRRSCKIGTSN